MVYDRSGEMRDKPPAKQRHAWGQGGSKECLVGRLENLLEENLEQVIAYGVPPELYGASMPVLS